MKSMRVMVLLVFLLGLAVSAVAAPYPMVEFFFVKYSGNNGLKRAEYAIRKTGFRLITGTYQGEDRVGVRGRYTAAIGLSTEYPTAVVFIISGPEYGPAKRWAREMQRYFQNAPIR